MNLGAGYSVSQVCRVLELPRSSYYYQAQTDTDQRTEIEAALQQLAAQWPTYGYRRLTVHLHREGYQVNSKRVRRLMAHHGLTRHAKPQVVHTTNSQHGFGRFPNLVERLVVKRP
jgi:putative transposase